LKVNEQMIYYIKKSFSFPQIRRGAGAGGRGVVCSVRRRQLSPSSPLWEKLNWFSELENRISSDDVYASEKNRNHLMKYNGRL